MRETPSVLTNNRSMWKALLVISFFAVTGNANDCVPRSFGPDKIVCVCNATYCDATPDNNPKVPEEGNFYWYVSTKKGLRMHMSKSSFRSCGLFLGATLTIDSTKQYQTILGYGGAFTDSTGINIKKLSPATQDQLIRAYYDPVKGSRYSLGRVPIGGTDFSTRPYTYDNVSDDTLLEHFALAPEDYDYKIPFIQKAMKLNPDTKLVSAAWSPPIWMKTSDRINGLGILKKEYYQACADYIVKFINEYKKNGLDIWAVTPGNEPTNGLVPFGPLNAMGWTPGTVADWVGDFLGPTLAASQHNRTLILALDDQRSELPLFVQLMWANEKAKKYSAGTAVHWYFDAYVPPVVLDLTHNAFPDKFILLTEASTGSLEIPNIILGSWERGQRYILSILEYMNHWAVGWVDWNLALDKKGGPTYLHNGVDSPIIVNPEEDEFYKQPMYYAVKHFSRFVGRGSVRISITDNPIVKAAAFATPSNEIVVVLYNKGITTTTVSLKDLKRGSLCVDLPAESMNTIIYRQ